MLNMTEDNLRGIVGGEAGAVFEGCQGGESVFYFIRKKSAIRIQRTWKCFADKNAKITECSVCRKQYKFMTLNYYCLHKLCNGCYIKWNEQKGNCPQCRAKPLRDKICRI